MLTIAEGVSELQARGRPVGRILVTSRAGTRVLVRSGSTWYLREVRGSDKLLLPATEGGGAGSPSPS